MIVATGFSLAKVVPSSCVFICDLGHSTSIQSVTGWALCTNLVTGFGERWGFVHASLFELSKLAIVFSVMEIMRCVTSIHKYFPSFNWEFTYRHYWLWLIIHVPFLRIGFFFLMRLHRVIIKLCSQIVIRRLVIIFL